MVWYFIVHIFTYFVLQVMGILSTCVHFRQQKEEDDAIARQWKMDNEMAIRNEADKVNRAKEENTRIKLQQLEEGASAIIVRK